MTIDGQTDSTVRPIVGTRVRAHLRSKELLAMGDATVIKETGGEFCSYVSFIHSQDTVKVSLRQDVVLLLFLNMQPQESCKRDNSPNPENPFRPQHEW